MSTLERWQGIKSRRSGGAATLLCSFSGSPPSLALRPAPACTRSSSRGITLVELVISIALLSIIGYVIISLYPTSILSLKRSHDQLAASHIAERHLEALRSARFETLTPVTNTTEQVGGTTFYIQEEATMSPNPNASSLKVTQAWSTYSTTSTPLSADPNVKYLRVSIRWNGGPTQGAGALWMSRTFETSVARMINP